MKTSILAILLCLTGAFAQANEPGNDNGNNGRARLVYKCDQKYGHKEAKIYHENDRFFICFKGIMSTTPTNDQYCERKVWSTDVDYKNDTILIDFMHDWMFEGDKHSGVLWNDELSYICERPHNNTDHDDHQDNTRP